MHDWTLDEAESEKVIKHALDLGYNFLTRQMGILLEQVSSIWKSTEEKYSKR